MDSEKQERLQRELLDGETIEWSGEPKPGAEYTALDILMIPGGLFWCGFSIYMYTSMTALGAFGFIGIFFAFFMIAGLYMVFGKYVLKYVRNKNTAYAITNRRILVLGRRSVSALELKDVPLVQKTERRNGSGSLDFEPSVKNTWGWNAGMDIWGFSRKNAMKFSRIENVKGVYILVSEKIKRAKATS